MGSPEKSPSYPPGVRSERALTALLAASTTINASLDLAKTLQAIARSAADVLEAEASSVLLLDKARAKLIFKAAVGARSEELLGEEFDAGLGVAGHVGQTGSPVLVDDVRTSPHFFKGIDNKSSFTTRDLVAAPMTYRGEVVGVVEVLNRRPPGKFNRADVELLGVFGNLAAIGTVNAQLHEALKRENRGLREVARRSEEIIGAGGALREVMALVDRVAGTNATVLLLGETGTGKEVTARAIHDKSPRRKRAIIAINCAALPETLLESELFGHEAGAFTGATTQKMGRFELADGGTLFLDEIGDISPSTQIKLLRVLQEREFVRVGGTKTIACDVRIITATNRDLRRAIADGKFREDLFYRLNVFPIELPPLRQRRADIPLLIDHFVQQISGELARPAPSVAPEVVEQMCAYAWPGNIRELRNIIERAVLMCDRGVIGLEQLPREVSGGGVPPNLAQTVAGESSLIGVEKALILKAMQDSGWNQTRAAKTLNISRDNLRYRLKKYQIERP